MILFDQAYFEYRRLALIDKNDSYFVSWLTYDTNPVVTDELREWSDYSISLEGEKIDDVVDDLHRQYIDVEVEVEFKRGKYNGTRLLDTKQLRVVGVRDEDIDDYHLYIITLKEFFPTDLARIYRYRWAVKQLFRELKTQSELDEFGITKEHMVKVLVYTALLLLLVSREWLGLVVKCAEDDAVFRRDVGLRSSGHTPSSSSLI